MVLIPEMGLIHTSACKHSARLAMKQIATVNIYQGDFLPVKTTASLMLADRTTSNKKRVS